MPDLIGVRVVVRYRREVEQVIEVVRELFDCSVLDDKSDRLAEDNVGYISVHTEARLKRDDAQEAVFPRAEFRVEIQMRTLAQHLWSEMSHDTFYKTDEQAISSELKRRVNLMAGLLEVADREFARLGEEVAGLPGMAELAVLRTLESYYYQFSAERGNPDLSLAVIKLLLPLYAMEPAAIGPVLDDFVRDRRTTISAVFEKENADPGHRSVFFTQPEVLMLYERLDHDSLGVRERWIELLPLQELERVALAFGISFD